LDLNYYVAILNSVVTRDGRARGYGSTLICVCVKFKKIMYCREGLVFSPKFARQAIHGCVL